MKLPQAAHPHGVVPAPPARAAAPRAAQPPAQPNPPRRAVAPGPLAPPRAAGQPGPLAPPAASRPPWWRHQDLCAHVASYLYAPRDVVSFEAALAFGNEPVDGLWGAFGGFRLRRILACEIAQKRRLLGHRRSVAADASYDLEMRELCTYGLADADLAQMKDARVRVLHRRLASESWQQLPLLAQVAREVHRRQSVTFGLLRGQWHGFLGACQEAALRGAPPPQMHELAGCLPELARRHERSWHEGSAWLTSGGPARRLRRVGARSLRGLLGPREGEPTAASLGPAGRPPAAVQPAWPLLAACLDALDAYAASLGLDCQTTPRARARPLAAGAPRGLQAQRRAQAPAEGGTWPGTG